MGKITASLPPHQKLWWGGVAIFCLASFATVGIAPLGGQIALAENTTSTQPAEPPSQADCKLEDALKALLTVKDSDLPQPEKDQAELNARKNVLGQIVICSQVELNTFKERLTNFDPKNSDKKDGLLRDKFLGDIDTAESYFSDASDSLAGDIDLGGVKTLAKELTAWRETFYVPTLSNMNDFTLVIQNQQAIKTARARFDKISFSLSAVKLNNATDIKKLLDEADAHIKKGTELNEQAHAFSWSANLISDNASSSPTSTLVTATSSSKLIPAADASGTIVSATSTPPILPLVRDSLNELKKAYGDYLAISDIVKKYLGL